jgi:hypothetical protein
MYVVLTPIISILFLGRKGNRTTWLAIILATVGLAMLSLHGWAIGIGEILTFSCALSCAAHIVGLGEWTPRDRVYGFTFVQIGTVAVVTLVASSPGGLTIPPDGEVWMAVIITAVLATAAGYLVQTWAQSLVRRCAWRVVRTMAGIRRNFRSDSREGTTYMVDTGGRRCILAACISFRLKNGIKVGAGSRHGGEAFYLRVIWKQSNLTSIHGTAGFDIIRYSLAQICQI